MYLCHIDNLNPCHSFSHLFSIGGMFVAILQYILTNAPVRRTLGGDYWLGLSSPRGINTANTPSWCSWLRSPVFGLTHVDMSFNNLIFNKIFQKTIFYAQGGSTRWFLAKNSMYIFFGHKPLIFEVCNTLSSIHYSYIYIYLTLPWQQHS